MTGVGLGDFSFSARLKQRGGCKYVPGHELRAVPWNKVDGEKSFVGCDVVPTYMLWADIFRSAMTKQGYTQHTSGGLL